MYLLQCLKAHALMVLMVFLIADHSFCQCAPQIGPPPSNSIFNTGADGTATGLPPSATDLHWRVAIDSINGTYNPAIVMDTLPSDYYRSPWSNCHWISISSKGNHSGNHTFFYRMDFALPCTNPCGVSYNNNNSFCLSLDLLADNSIYEIYVNGIPQSGNLGKLIPVLPDPYHAVGMGENGMISLSLCNNWKAGANSIVIEVASSGPVTGLLAQGSTVLNQPISNFIVASICQGEVYHLDSQSLTHAGLVFERYHLPSGCDSTVALNLAIKPAPHTTISDSICEGGSFLGYSVSGIFTDTFTAANNCDSLRTLN
jgi:hypothetical protein